jgi:hypothetical protein
MVSVSRQSKYECECDGLSVSASAWSDSDSVVLGDSSILHPIRQSIVLTIHMIQPRQTRTTHIHTRMSRNLIHIHILRHLSSLTHIHIHIHIHLIHIRLRTDLGQYQRVERLECQ